MGRLAYVVDGFNLYHSIVDAQKDARQNYRWLDVRSLCESFSSAIGGGIVVGDVFYFSAYAHHRESYSPGTVGRHKALVSAFEATGVTPQMANFKAKDIDYKCRACGHKGTMRRHEEKETDVAVAVKIVELALDPEVDAIAIMSGDTDLLPAVRRAKEHKPLYMVFPYRRHSGDLEALATAHFDLKIRHYAAHQLNNPVIAGDVKIECPKRWT